MEKGQLRPPVLVFVQEKDRAKDLFNELIKEKIHVDVIHSERSQLQRDNSVRAFRAGQIWVLICTELMGRGIDFKVSIFVTFFKKFCLTFCFALVLPKALERLLCKNSTSDKLQIFRTIFWHFL